MMVQPELILFAKQPQPGKVKTRLLPRYSPDKAAEIATFLLRATVELSIANWPGTIRLYCAPDATHPLFQALAREFGLHLAPQAEGDLGVKMYEALHAGAMRERAAAVFGSDLPHCPWDVLDDANHWLAHGQNVLGPAEDGGYYFIGLQQQDVHPGLFEGIDWGTSRVFEQTLARAAALGIEFELLPRLRDIDTADDLWLVAQQHEPLRAFLK